MNTEDGLNELRNLFVFHGIVPDHDLEKEANQKLIQLLALAPPGSYANASLKWTGNHYFSNVEIHSPFRSFSAQAFGTSASSVIKRALQKLEDQIYRWRFGGGTSYFGSGSNTYQIGKIPWKSSR